MRVVMRKTCDHNYIGSQERVVNIVYGSLRSEEENQRREEEMMREQRESDDNYIEMVSYKIQ